MIIQGHDGRHNDTVTGVDAYGINIFHAADGDGMAGRVPHNLKLDFLVPLDRLFHQNLMDRGELEGVQANLSQLLLAVGKAAAGAAQGKGGAQNNGVADSPGSFLGFFNGIGDFGGNNRLADGLAQLLEQLTVLGTLDGIAQQLHAALLQDALLFQLHGQIQTGLAADAGNNGVGPLVADDFGHIFQGQRLHVDLISDGGIGHNGGRVGVYQNNFVTLFFQCQAGLGACVVKFSGLADDDGT